MSPRHEITNATGGLLSACRTWRQQKASSRDGATGKRSRSRHCSCGSPTSSMPSSLPWDGAFGIGSSNSVKLPLGSLGAQVAGQWFSAEGYRRANA
jgi:hypothetical protein